MCQKGGCQHAASNSEENTFSSQVVDGWELICGGRQNRPLPTMPKINQSKTEERRLPSAAATTYPTKADHPVGKKIHPIYLDRLRQFTSGGQYEASNLPGKLIEGRATGDEWVSLEVWSVPDLERPPFKEAQKQEYKKTHVGESFGPSWSTHWFRITLTVPPELQTKDHLEFHWDANNEGLIYTETGEIVHGLTGEGQRDIYILPKKWYDGKPHLFYIEMACNHMFGNAFGDNIQPPPTDRYYQLWKAEIVAVNLEVRALNIDFWEIGDAAREFPGDSYESHNAFSVCNQIMDEFIAGEGSKETIVKCRQIAQDYFKKSVDSSSVYDGDAEVLVTAIGHCHIDTCWLWPWAETKRKVARSWSNQIDLIERYPEFRFCCSQAQQYKWLEMYHPDLFDRVKEKVKEGKFHPIGGSWVEHDTNMPSGESLTRQFIYGQRFFEGRFGARCTTFWLPDTFGYSAQLPQLCRLAGMSRFFTQKLSWNNINNFPHTTFNWVALDGTQVLCHMTPAETYTAEANFGDVKRCMTQHKNLDEDPTSLLVYGKGDGGGGPTYEHIEKLRRIRAISDRTSLLPRPKLGNSVDDFFEQLEQKIKKGKEFPTWYGELYFELHRGTYTTQANNKRNNRKAEFLIRTVEYLSTLATLAADVSPEHKSKKKPKKFKYPKKEIDFMWEAVLLCQFHDCLPGSSIEMCYDDSDKLYAEVFTTGEKCVEAALEELGFDDGDDKNSVVPVHFTPWVRNSIVSVPSKDPTVEPRFGVTYDTVDFDERPEWDAGVHVKEIRKGVYEMGNMRVRMVLEDGVITSLYDIENRREVIAEGGKANQFVLFDDKPLYWQAWDVEVYHLESRRELTSSYSYIAEQTSHTVSVVTVTRISEKSSLKSKVSLDVGWHDRVPLVNVETEVDWHEDKKFLKVEFPVDVTSSYASYESAYGIVQRPTHYNTSWDMAKFEVCCHKWADLSEASYGVAILNDSKYGFATCGNVMRLSLLRAPKAPDAHADMGKHVIRYSIAPHRGPVNHHVIKEAFNLNNPIRIHRHPEPAQFAKLNELVKWVDAPNVVLDVIKRGEDDEDVSYPLPGNATPPLPTRKGKSVVVRLYDALGGKSTGNLIFKDLPVKKVYRSNLLEDDVSEIVMTEPGSVELTVKAFEVVTLRLQM